MTHDQFALLQDKVALWRKSSIEGSMELRDYNRRAGEALTAALVERADLLKALNALRDELCGIDQWWGKLREAADAADEAIDRAGQQ